MKPTQQDRAKAAAAANVTDAKMAAAPKAPVERRRGRKVLRWVLLLLVIGAAVAAWMLRAQWLPKVPGYQPPVVQQPGSAPLEPQELAAMVRDGQLSECVRNTLQAKVKEKVLTHSDLRAVRSQCVRQERQEAQDQVRDQQAKALDGSLPPPPPPMLEKSAKK